MIRNVAPGLKKPLTLQGGAEKLKPVGRKRPKTPMAAYAVKTLQSTTIASAGGEQNAEADASEHVSESTKPLLDGFEKKTLQINNLIVKNRFQLK